MCVEGGEVGTGVDGWVGWDSESLTAGFEMT